MGLEHDDYLQQLFCGGTYSIALRQKQPQEMFCKKRPQAYNFIKKTFWHISFSVVSFPIRTAFLQTTSGQLLILLHDFIFQSFSMIDLISPTIKDHYIKCKFSKCFREGITKSSIYYQFAARTVVKNLAPGM